ncbi:glutaredoxin family protein [Savagea sp. SN6]|uniref:Glutaredoxin family protein n=1 Tax=Savagea serpentis TaxID=2785297 RepID=A0A8J7G4R2_9BACL|nr:glutaredoxin family protein [Savagea serpentis]MBF4501207.1 glutaredoxin family protein [Savagea serpentis]
MVKLTLYINDNCELCDEALQSIELVRQDVDLLLDVVSIVKDDELQKKYMLEVPVLFIDGEQKFQGHITYGELLETLLDE